ncbi:MAG: hypothetical protein OHK0022_55830 [Roseiflexaceae bacterium]
MIQLIARIKRAAGRDLLVNAGSMIGTTVVTAGLGFVYWWLAARHFSQEAVGIASALISAMGLLGSLGMVGLGTLLIGELARRPRQAAVLLTTGLLASGVVSAVLGLLFVLLAPLLSPEFNDLRGGPGVALLFSLGVVLTAVTLVLDQALIGLLRGGLQLWRNTIFAVAKLVVLLLLGLWAAGSGSIAIYTTWTAGNLISLAAIALAARRGLRPARPEWELLRQLPGAALEHHALNLALQLPGLALPVIVTALLSPALNASFYMSWLLLHMVYAVPYTLTTVLFAAGAADTQGFTQKIRMTLGAALALGLLSNLVLWPSAGLILGVFGREYAEQAAWSMRVMALGVFPLIVKDHFVAVRRVQSQIRGTAALAMLGSALELAFGAAGAALGGLTGLAFGFVLALCLEALLMARPVWQAARPSAGAVVMRNA